MISISRGNLLTAPAQALVNTVNTEGVMGKGIALQFRNLFTDMYQRYAEDCKAGRVKLGLMNVFDRGALVQDGPRYIINFPTKGHWRSKSRVKDIEVGLQDLLRVIRELGIESIALPPLGCGNGGLDWAEVKPLIYAALENESVNVLLFEPAGAPPAADMPRRTGKPAMNEARAILVVMMDRYLKGLLDPFISLLEVQKLMYFMQEAGQPLRLQYTEGRYGPYAVNLGHQLKRMEGHYVLGFGDGADRPTTSLELMEGAVDAAWEVLGSNELAVKRMERVTRLIEGFEDSYGMELLSSMHWMMVKNPEARANVDEAIRSVQAWNPRKQATMKPEHLRKAWERLASEDWHFLAAGIDQLSVVE